MPFSKNSLILLTFLITVGLVRGRYHNFEEDVTLTAEQKELLDTFKEQVSPFLQHEYQKENIYLIRWLRFKNFDLQDAENALFENMKWREENKMDGILQEDFSDFMESYKTWNEGRDRRGKPILYFEAATHDTRKAIVTGKSERYLRYTDMKLEEMSKLVRELGNKYGNVTRAHLVLNMDGYNLIVHGCAQCVPILLRMIWSFQNHYPQLSDQLILVNTPAVIEPLMNMIKTILVQETRESIRIFGTNKKHYMKILSEEFDFQDLPPGVGGTKLYKGMEDEF